MHSKIVQFPCTHRTLFYPQVSVRVWKTSLLYKVVYFWVNLQIFQIISIIIQFIRLDFFAFHFSLIRTSWNLLTATFFPSSSSSNSITRNSISFLALKIGIKEEEERKFLRPLVTKHVWYILYAYGYNAKRHETIEKHKKSKCLKFTQSDRQCKAMIN